ncbi:MAG: hypothetical protein V4549_07530 [Bacteroidota bacterium]
MNQDTKHPCIIKDNDEVRTLLNGRFERLKLSSRAITKDAKDNGRTFTEQSLSRYRNHGNVKGAIQTEDVMWLCEKYSIKLKLRATRAKKNGKK